MDSLENMQARVEDLLRRHRAADAKKSKLAGQLEVKRQELARLGKEIREAGYSPKDLKAERDKAASELEGLIETFGQDLAQVERALAAIDES
jgi:hypothetical protein